MVDAACRLKSIAWGGAGSQRTSHEVACDPPEMCVSRGPLRDAPALPPLPEQKGLRIADPCREGYDERFSRARRGAPGGAAMKQTRNLVAVNHL
jgi:hypothetical protein